MTERGGGWKNEHLHVINGLSLFECFLDFLGTKRVYLGVVLGHMGVTAGGIQKLHYIIYNRKLCNLRTFIFSRYRKIIGARGLQQVLGTVIRGAKFLG